MGNFFDQFDAPKKDTGSSANYFDRFDTPATAPAATKPDEETGDTARGFKRAFAQIPELAYGTGALAAQSAEKLFGSGGLSTATKDFFVRKFQESQQENQQYAPTVEFTTAWDSLKDGDLNPMIDWLQDSAGYVVGQGIQTIATGGVGAIVGKQVLRSATEKMLATTVAKGADKIMQNAAKAGVKITAEQAAKQSAERIASAIGAGIALNAQNLGMEAGDIYGGLSEQAQEQGREITGDDLWRAWGAAGAAAFTETATDLLGLGALTGRIKIGNKTIQELTGTAGRAARAGVAAGIGLPIESGQEYIQTGLEQYGAGQPLDTDEASKERINAAAVGGLGGAVMGGGIGATTGPQAPIIQRDEAEDIAFKIVSAPDVDTAIKAAAAAAEGVPTTGIINRARSGGEMLPVTPEDAGTVQGTPLLGKGVSGADTVPFTEEEQAALDLAKVLTHQYETPPSQLAPQSTPAAPTYPALGGHASGAEVLPVTAENVPPGTSALGKGGSGAEMLRPTYGQKLAQSGAQQYEPSPRESIPNTVIVPRDTITPVEPTVDTPSKRAPTLLETVANMGVINIAEKMDIIGDTKGNQKVAYVGNVFTRKGDTLDGMAEKLTGEGWFTEEQRASGEANRLLAEMIRDEMTGTKQHAKPGDLSDLDHRMRASMEQYYADRPEPTEDDLFGHVTKSDLAAVGYNKADEQTKDLTALFTVARTKLGDDEFEALAERVAVQNPDITDDDFERIIRQEIENHGKPQEQVSAARATGTADVAPAAPADQTAPVEEVTAPPVTEQPERSRTASAGTATPSKEGVSVSGDEKLTQEAARSAAVKWLRDHETSGTDGVNTFNVGQPPFAKKGEIEVNGPRGFKFKIADLKRSSEKLTPKSKRELTALANKIFDNDNSNPEINRRATEIKDSVPEKRTVEQAHAELTAILESLNEPEEREETPTKETAKGETSDMFGGKNDTAQAVADREAERQKKMREAPPVESGEGDLFSGKAKQVDVEDVAKPVRQELTPVSKRGKYYVEFEGQRYPVDSFKDASEKWDQFRDKTGAGASEIGSSMRIYDQGGNVVAHVSYNGKVWPGRPEDRTSDTQPLYGEKWGPPISRDEWETPSMAVDTKSGEVTVGMGAVKAEKVEKKDKRLVPKSKRLTEREKYPDGRLIPVEDDKVYQAVRGFGGTPAYINGIVVKGKNGLRVKVTGTASMLGGMSTNKSYNMTSAWTVVDDPEIARREDDKKTKEADAKRRDEEQRNAERAKTEESAARAVASGEKMLADVEPAVGMKITDHYNGDPITGEITELAEFGGKKEPIVKWGDATHGVTIGNQYWRFTVVEKPAPASGAPSPSVSKLAAYDDFYERLHEGKASLDEYKQEFERFVADKDAIKAELSKLTKDELLRRGGQVFAYRNKNEKKGDVVNSLYAGMMQDFNITSSGISYIVGGGNYEQSRIDAVRKRVEAVTQADMDKHVEDVKKARAERKAKIESVAEGIKNPQSLDDFARLLRAKIDGGMSYREARLSLTPEQRVRYDELAAEGTRKERSDRRTTERTTVRAAGATTGAEIIATKHTQKGYDLFVVKAAERVEREVYNAWNAAAKKLGGWYSSYNKGGAVPGFQFKERAAAEAFQKFVSGGDTEAVQEQAKVRRDAYADDRSQTAVERLREMAGKLEERADESLSQDRKVNTARRARMAASAEADANHRKSLASTMRNIAQAIEDGKAKFLDQVRQKVQVEMLNGFVSSAKYSELRAKYKDYIDQEKHKYEKPTAETVEYAEWPTYTAYRSDLARLGRELLEVDGLKLIGQRILKVADDITDAYTKFAKENLDKISRFSTKGGERPVFPTKDDAEAAIIRSGYKGKAVSIQMKRGQHLVVMSPTEAQRNGIWKGDDDKRITLTPDFGAELVEKAARLSWRHRVSLPHQFESAAEQRKRFAAMGIETSAEFRSALREFIQYREAPPAPDKVKEMERAMIGRRKDGLDFFPTPADTADQMVAAADIKEGMTILEPSAGMGHIADRIREAGFEPDVVELSGDRRELLEAKGYNVAGSDFMDLQDAKYDRIIMNPPFSDRRDMQHVQHAYNLLKPGGRLVAIMGEGVFFGSDKKATEFRNWLERVGGTDEKLDEGTFQDTSLPVNTAVNARMVVIDKPEGGTTDFSMLDAEPAPAFYSALAKGVETLKTNTAPAGMWKSAIRNLAQKGVKQEEIDWSGVEAWLDSQTGKVTKQQILDFLKANEIQIKEVTRGSSGQTEAVAEMRELLGTLEMHGYNAEWEPSVVTDEYTVINAFQVPGEKNKEGYPLAYYADDDFAGMPEEDRQKALRIRELSRIADAAADTTFERYTLPGGKNYTELLLTLKPLPDSRQGRLDAFRQRMFDKYGPGYTGLWSKEERDEFHSFGKEPDLKFRSSHFTEPNILAHVRFNERTDADGKRVLFIEEVQSDWHQRGRRDGYKPVNYDKRIADMTKQIEAIESQFDDVNARGMTDANIKEEERLIAEKLAIVDEMNKLHDAARDGVPAAPFKTTWPMLAMKRMIRYAAENGFDRIAWTTGEQQADRYDLSKQIDGLLLQDGEGDTVDVQAFKNGSQVIDREIEESKLADVIGKDLAERYFKDRENADPHLRPVTYSGIDLKVGGEGMVAFYDQMLPSMVNKYVKKWGAKVGATDIDVEESGGEWAIIDATDEGGQQVLERFDTEEEARSEMENAGDYEGGGVDVKYMPTGIKKVHSLDITPEMRDSVLQGQPMFDRTGATDTETTPHVLKNRREETPAIKTLREAVEDAVGRPLEKGAFTDSGLPDAFREVAGAIKKVYGKDVVFFRNNIPDTIQFGGLTTDRDKKTIYINVAHKKPFVYIAGHELLHLLRRDRPDIYNRLHRIAQQEFDSEAVKQYGEGLSEFAERNKLTLTYLEDKVHEEMLANFIGDNFARPVFWAKLAETEPNVFLQLARTVYDYMKKLLTMAKARLGVAGYRSNEYFRDLEKMRDAAGQALKEYAEHARIMARASEKTGRDTMFSPEAADQTDTPEFKRWFGDSKVVDENGKPLVVYHGTTEDIESFRLNKTGQRTGNKYGRGAIFFTSNPAAASAYAAPPYGEPHPLDQPNVVPAYLSLKNPLEIDADDRSWTTVKDRIKAAQKQGHDGAIVRNVLDHASAVTAVQEGPVDVFVAFRPEQIKSAIGNRGTFDPNNPDINFSPMDTIEARLPAAKDRMSKIADYLIFNYQDRFMDLRRIQKRAGAVPESQNASLAEELYAGRVAARVQDFHDDMGEPLIKNIHDSGLKLEEVERYLHALHAPSRNAAMREINPTEDEIKAARERLTAKRNDLAENEDVQEYLAQRRNLRTVQDEIDDGVADESDAEVIRGELDRLERIEAVGEYADTMARLKALKNIQPYDGDNTALSGMSDEEAARVIEEAEESGKREALDRISAQVDAITAKTREIYADAGLMTPEAVEAMADKYEHYVPLHRDEVGGDNPVVGQGYNLRGSEVKRATGSTKEVTNIVPHLLAQHEAAIIRAEKAKVDRALFEFAQEHPDPELWSLDTAENLRVVDPMTGTVVDRINPLYKQKPNVLTLKIAGKEHTITFNESNPEALRLAASMKNLSSAQLGEVTQMVGRFTRLLATMNTSANPVFVVRNFLRDLQTAYVNLTDTELADLKKDVFRDVPAAIRGFWHMARGNMDNEWARHAREFRDAGGQTGWLDHYKNIADRAERLKAQLKGMEKGKWNLTKQEAAKWWSLIEDANNAVENGVRLSAYVNARRAGVSSAKAAALAKNLTVNFNRRGAKGVELNMWYMFANASIQGTARLLKALGHKKVRQILGYVMASAFLMDVLARALAGDDDDDGENDYDQMLEHTKANNFVFWAGNRPITIPMPYGYNFFASVGRKFSEAMFRKNYSPARSAVDLVNVFVDAFNPTGQSGSLLQFAAPTVADPFIQWAENKNFAGYPLRREQIPFGPPKPEYQMGLRSTSAPAKWLAEVLNNLTGGNEVRPGVFNLNPGAIDFAISSIAGGAGRSYLQAFSLPVKALSGDDISAREVPFANIFLGSKPEFQVQNKFYENLRAVELTQDEYKRYRGDPEMIKQIREEHGADLRMIDRAKLASRSLKKLRERERLIERSKAANRDALMENIETRRRQIMADFNKRYGEARQ